MEPIRTCAVCRRTGRKSEMLRVAKSGDSFAVDLEQKLPGRGAYLCRNAACLHAAVTKKTLNRAFRCSVPSQVYSDLEAFSNGDKEDGEPR